jgi:phospholipase/carboxylesterase
MERNLTVLSGPSWGPASGEAPRQLIIICHGYGADGHDLIELAPYGGAVLPDAVFVAPHAPEPAGMAPGGRQWFPLDDLDPQKLAAGVRAAAARLDEFIDASLTKYKIPADAYALLGFSQGAMTVLFAGLRRIIPPRAILAFSGALIDPGALATAPHNHAPVLLVHGEADPVVPAFRSRDAETALRAAGVPVQSLFIPGLGHSIDNAGLNAAAAALKAAFPPVT